MAPTEKNGLSDNINMNTSQADTENKSPVRILLAEDNVVSQQALKLMLQKLGYMIDIVENGLEALDALDENKYDLLLMDLEMPKLDGISAAKRILKTHSESERPIMIALTGNSSDADKEACLKAGMDGFISKPIRLPDLKTLLEKRLAEFKSRRK